MERYITIEQALKKGQRMIRLSGILISSATFLFLFLDVLFLEKTSYWGVIIGSPAGIAFCVLYMSYMTTKWRIWAFSNVEDVHVLKKAAITEKLIAEDGSWQEKLEIITAADKEKLTEIQQRLSEPYTFVDDLTIPPETTFIGSFGYLNISAGIMLVFGIPALFILDNIFLGIISVLVGIIGMLWKNRFLTGKKYNLPQTTISDKGILLKNGELHPWQDIFNELLARESIGKINTGYYTLWYNYNKKRISINLGYIKLGSGQLYHLLSIYRHRSQQNIFSSTI